MKTIYILPLLIAAFGLGCEYYTLAPEEVRYVHPSEADATVPQAVQSPASSDDEAITPEIEDAPVVGETPPDTGAETESDAEPETEDEAASFCPPGSISQGDPYLCCRLDEPQVCFYVDPVPGDGGGRPALDGLSTAETNLLHDPDPPPDDPTPPPGGGGGIGDHDQIPCRNGDSYGVRRRRVDGTQAGTPDEVEDPGDCIII